MNKYLKCLFLVLMCGISSIVIAQDVPKSNVASFLDSLLSEYQLVHHFDEVATNQHVYFNEKANLLIVEYNGKKFDKKGVSEVYQNYYDLETLGDPMIIQGMYSDTYFIPSESKLLIDYKYKYPKSKVIEGVKNGDNWLQVKNFTDSEIEGAYSYVRRNYEDYLEMNDYDWMEFDCDFGKELRYIQLGDFLVINPQYAPQKLNNQIVSNQGYYLFQRN